MSKTRVFAESSSKNIMRAQSSKLNGMRLPCPRCQQPASIDARSCSCGYRFVAEHSSQVKPRMPELKRVVPGFKPIVHKFPTPAANTTAAKTEGTPKIVTGDDAVAAVANESLGLPVASPQGEIVKTESVGLTTVYSEPQMGLLPPGRYSLFTYVLAGTSVVALAFMLGAFALLNSWGTGAADTPDQAQATEVPSVKTDDPAPSTEAKPDVSTNGGFAFSNEDTADIVRETAPSIDENSRDSHKKPIEHPKPVGLVAEKAPEDSKVLVSSEKPATANTVEPANTAVATARCADGTFSYRKTRSGTCSHRGGVAEWLDGSKASTKPAEAKPAKTETATPNGERKFILGSRGGCYYLGPSGNKNYVDKSFCN